MLKYYSVTPPENSGGAENSTEIQAHMPKTFFALCTNLVYDIRSGYRKLTSILVTVYGVIAVLSLPLFYGGEVFCYLDFELINYLSHAESQRKCS